MQLIILIMC